MGRGCCLCMLWVNDIFLCLAILVDGLGVFKVADLGSVGI